MVAMTMQLKPHPSLPFLCIIKEAVLQFHFTYLWMCVIPNSHTFQLFIFPDIYISFLYSFQFNRMFEISYIYSVEALSVQRDNSLKMEECKKGHFFLSLTANTLCWRDLQHAQSARPNWICRDLEKCSLSMNPVPRYIRL